MWSYNLVYSDEIDDKFNNYIDDIISVFDNLFNFAITLGAFCRYYIRKIHVR